MFREPEIHRNSPQWRDAWTGLSVVLDLPFSWSGKIDGGKASARLSVGLAGTNDFRLAWFDENLAFRAKGWMPARHTPNGETVYTNVAGIELSRFERDDFRRDRLLHTVIGDRFLVLKIPASLDPPELWDDFWKSAAHAFAQPGWTTGASGFQEAGDMEAWGLETWPGFAERAAAVGLVCVALCRFDSREDFHDGRLLAFGNPRKDIVDSPGWRLRLYARRKGSDGNPSFVSAMLCACEGDGDPKGLWKDAPGMRRRQTDGGRFLLLCPDSPFYDDSVWDDIFAALPTPEQSPPQGTAAP